MTRRELCERLMNIHNSVMIASGGTGDVGENPCYDIGKALRDLVLDIAVPETEKDRRKRQDDFLRCCGLISDKEEEK